MRLISYTYTIMDSTGDAVKSYLSNNTEYWRFYDYDQVMRYSDYTVLREMQGYSPAELGPDEYIINCMQHLAPSLWRAITSHLV